MKSRWPVPILLVALVVVALLVGDADASDRPHAPKTRDAVALAPATALTSAWFCPGAPPSLPIDQETVTITNTSEDDEEVIVTVLPDDGTPAVAETVDIAANSVSISARSELGPPGAITVEAFSRDVVVESGFTTSGLLASGPCASTTAPEWHLAAGTTVRGVEQYLVVFNPLGTDAKVDIALRTADGALPIESLKAVDVPRRARLVIPVHEYAIRTERVAVDVNATVGRVVVEQEIVFGADSGSVGVTRSLGVPAPAASWTFADGTTLAGASAVVALSNPGAVDADVDVFATVAVDVPISPVMITVPRGSVVWVALGCPEPPTEDCVPVPPESDFAVEIDTDSSTPVVAEVLARLNGSPVGSGAAAVTGAREGAERWIVPRVAFADATTVLAIVNPDIRPVVVDVAVIHDGAVDDIDELQGIEILPNQRFGTSLSGFVTGDAALLVTAAGPVVVERAAYAAGDFSRAPAVPADDR